MSAAAAVSAIAVTIRRTGRQAKPGRSGARARVEISPGFTEHTRVQFDVRGSAPKPPGRLSPRRDHSGVAHSLTHRVCDRFCYTCILPVAAYHLTPTTENTEHTETKHWVFSVISAASVVNVICLDSN